VCSSGAGSFDRHHEALAFARAARAVRSPYLQDLSHILIDICYQQSSRDSSQLSIDQDFHPYPKFTSSSQRCFTGPSQRSSGCSRTPPSCCEGVEISKIRPGTTGDVALLYQLRARYHVVRLVTRSCLTRKISPTT